MRTFHIGFLVVVCGVALGMMGCLAVEAVGDFLFGVDSQGNDLPGESPAGILGSILSVWLPGAAGVLAAGAGAYGSWRGKNWKALAKSTFATVEALGDTEPGKALKAKLAKAHEKDLVGGYAKIMAKKVGG